MDVRSASAVAAFFQGVETVDLLVNNAGNVVDRPFLRMTEEEWDAVVDTHLKGAFLCARAVLPGMLKRRAGHLLQIGSYAARRPGVGQASYAAAKAGLIGLTQSLAAEVGSRGIRVNCVLPGFLETKMTEDLPGDVKEAARGRHALSRFNTPEEVARAILALEASPHTSGQVIQLDSRIVRWT